MSGMPMLPPSTTGAWPAPSTAAVSELVVVLPLVPVTPMVAAGTEAQEEVDLAHHRDPAFCLDGAQSGPQARLRGREVRAHRRRGADERLADQRVGGIDFGAQQQPWAARTKVRHGIAQCIGRTAVIDRHQRTLVDQEAGQRRSTARQAEHGHRSSPERVQAQLLEVDGRGGRCRHQGQLSIPMVAM